MISDLATRVEREPPSRERITFRRRGDILRGKICVGWIKRCADSDLWGVRFTPASHIPGYLSTFTLLREAKAAALRALAEEARRG